MYIFIHNDADEFRLAHYSSGKRISLVLVSYLMLYNPAANIIFDELSCIVCYKNAHVFIFLMYIQ